MNFIKVVESIYKKHLKNGDISWYKKKRVNGVSTWIKIGSKNKNNIKNVSDAIMIYEKSIECKEVLREIIPQSYTLNELATIYYEKRANKIKRLLRENYTHLSDSEFENMPLLKIKLGGSQKEVYQYNKNVKKTKLGHTNIYEIGIKEIDNFLENDLAQSKISQKTKFNIYANLKTIVNYAKRHQIISNIENPFFNNLKNPRNSRQRALNPQEIKMLLDKAKNENMNVYMPIYLAVLTGGRANTVLNIRKKDINLSDKTISLFNFKANKKYKLMLNDRATQWFSKILATYESEEYLVRSERPHLRKPPYKQMLKIPHKVYEIMDNLFNQNLNKQNNNDRDLVVNFHSIRRSIATNLAKSGTPLYDIMIFLNHSSISQTEKYLNMTSNNLKDSHNQLMSKIFIEY